MPVHIINRHPALSASMQRQLRKIAGQLLLSCAPLNRNVNIVFTDDQELASLNLQYRGKNGPTNVLSFPFSDGADLNLASLPIKELGDIVISVDTAEKEARQIDVSLKYRLSWLITHGILHLCGYDHEKSEKDADLMHAREKHLMNEITKPWRKSMISLAVNVDHVATIRQARGINEPDPITAAALCELAGAKGIVVHLREDRRHIQDRDVRILRDTIKTKLNLEMGAAKDIIAIALELKPDMITLVPEKRQELTTEGGLDVASQKKKLAKVIEKMRKADIPVSLFIDPDSQQVEAAHDIGATFVELHTGAYADAQTEHVRRQQFELIENSAIEAYERGLRVNAGHGLNYVNTAPIAALDTIEELSIGHAIISRAVFSGLQTAVTDMLAIINKASLF